MIDFDRLDNALQSATTPVPALFRAVMDCGGGRLSLLRRSGKCSVIDHLIASGAWTDAALALIQLGMPAWIVRRLAYEDSEWHCSLSRHPNVPIALDDMAEARHEILALAILRALVGAARRGTASARPIFRGSGGPACAGSNHLLRQLRLKRWGFCAPSPPLCRPYAVDPGSVSNSYATKSTLACKEGN